ncbi:hypothetical protein ABTX77_19490 [Streptomyces sp. NPDC097704]|uniref:hypothetical protein n=1 Tax=Streptomyces sp. NPDC097704 TaxID=3157101 RepID=UPI003317058F
MSAGTATPGPEAEEIASTTCPALVRKTVPALSPPPPISFSGAVLHLQAAVEVLFKARLLAEHWTLVFADLHQATRKKLESADFKSVTTDAAVIRLRNIVGVPITDPYDFDEIATCRFCSWEWDTAELAGYFGDADHDEPGTWNTCPKCYQWALGSEVPVRNNPDAPAYFCFACAIAFPTLLSCTRCGRPVEATQVTGTVLCGACEMDQEDEKEHQACYEDPKDYGYAEESE